MKNLIFKLLFPREYTRLNELEEAVSSSVVIITNPKGIECKVEAIWVEYPDGTKFREDMSLSPIIMIEEKEGL